jgi:hypothetical protein
VSLSPEAAPPAPVTECPLCGTALAPDATRCTQCGYHLVGIPGRPTPWTKPALWWTAAGLLIVYAITLLIVALAR